MITFVTLSKTTKETNQMMVSTGCNNNIDVLGREVQRIRLRLVIYDITVRHTCRESICNIGLWCVLRMIGVERTCVHLV